MSDPPPHLEPAASGVCAADVTLRARDGVSLAATIFEPAAEQADGGAVVLVAPATAVRRSLYAGLAHHLACRGFRVVTWDWRGTGDSRPASLRGFEATMSDWGRLDLGGVLDVATAHWPGDPLLVVGHSFGGQSLGLADGADRIQGAVLVAAQSGYWGHWPGLGKLRLAFLWHVLMPLVTWILGWFPGRTLGLGGDLPAGVARQWARWCRSPEYLGAELGWDGHRALTFPVDAFAITDDPFAPRTAVAALCRHFGGEVTLHDLAPADVDARQLGHFGMFKPGVPAFWDRVADLLGRRAMAPPSAAGDGVQ